MSEPITVEVTQEVISVEVTSGRGPEGPPGATTIDGIDGLQAALDAKATAAQGTKADTAVQPAALSTALAAKADLVSGLVPTSQIPAVALTNGQAVTSRAAMLALAAQPGDIAVITTGADKGTYILKEDGAATVWADWLLMNAPSDMVSSVNGQQGTVVLGAADVGAVAQSASTGAIVYARVGGVDQGITFDSGAASALTIARRNASGQVVGAAPTSAEHLTPRSYVDAQRDAVLLAMATPLIAGRYYVPVATSLAANAFDEGRLRGAPMTAGRSCTLDRIAVEVTVAGSAGALVRLGILRMTSAGALERLVDAGAIDATTIGVKWANISVAVNAGDVLIPVMAVQGGATTRPAVRSHSGVTHPALQYSASAETAIPNTLGGFETVGITGAIPATVTPSGIYATMPRLAIRAAT